MGEAKAATCVYIYVQPNLNGLYGRITYNLCCVVGPKNGLELVINVEQYENIPALANNIGVQVSNRLTVVD